MMFSHVGLRWKQCQDGHWRITSYRVLNAQALVTRHFSLGFRCTWFLLYISSEKVNAPAFRVGAAL